MSKHLFRNPLQNHLIDRTSLSYRLSQVLFYLSHQLSPILLELLIHFFKLVDLCFSDPFAMRFEWPFILIITLSVFSLSAPVAWSV